MNTLIRRAYRRYLRRQHAHVGLTLILEAETLVATLAKRIK